MTGTRARILLVDDKAATRTAVARMLKSKYDIFESDDGSAALARIKGGERFDLILMDVEMPIVNGPEAFRRIAIMEPELAERIVFLTGGARDPDIQAWLATLDPGRLLWKPVGAAELREALERIEGKRGRISRDPSSNKIRAGAQKGSMSKIKAASSGKIQNAEPSKRPR
jgi:two-component system NtrC family sensor kinase